MLKLYLAEFMEQFSYEKEDQQFLLEAFDQLKGTEDKVSFARQFYNDTVQKYNDSLLIFPNNIIANMFGFKEGEFFKVDSEEAKKAPKVQF